MPRDTCPRCNDLQAEIHGLHYMIADLCDDDNPSSQFYQHGFLRICNEDDLEVHLWKPSEQELEAFRMGERKRQGYEEALK